MDKTFQKFLRSGIDLSYVGVERLDDNTSYFCTPKGASIFGWAGVDGIHFCFIRGFGGMTFVVSPENGAPNYVYPLSKNFEDFLRLLIACGDVAALEQAWMWNQEQFDAFLQENPPTEVQRQVLSVVAQKLKLTPMEKPWAYIKELQTSFDYSKITFTEEYYDVVMNPAAEQIPHDWKVFFDGGFWEYHGKERQGKEIEIRKQFDWAGNHWEIPAVYSCSKGLVVDLCMRVEANSIRKFMEKWNLYVENDSYENFTKEQQMLIDLENPLCLNFDSHLILNGKMLHTSHGHFVYFNPCLPDGVINETEAKCVMDHYGLDPTFGWVICRNTFLWESKHRPEIKSLSLVLDQRPNCVPGPIFKVHSPGDSFNFSHPATGKEYTLTVQELEPQTMDQNCFGSERWLYPTNYVAMSYTLTPKLDECIMICDCKEGDKPLEITPSEESFSPACAASVGIIGGAHGPTTIMFEDNVQVRLHAAFSSLHFEPFQDDVEWRVIFNIKKYEKEQFLLI